MNFAGFDDWFEVFRAGTHTDSSGKNHSFTADDIAKMASTYDAARHEAPIVIGHPQHDAPAYGWTEGLKAEGGVLFAKAKNIVPEFSDMVRQGLFKKRSIALYPDKSLRHIGFLGAMPPAVKGLKDISFSAADGPAIVIEFGEPSWAFDSIARVFRRFREWLIETQDTDTADRVVPEYMIDDIKQATTPAQEADSYLEKKEEPKMEDGKNTPPQTFSEADVEKIRADARDQGRQEAQAEFAEKEKKNREQAAKADIAAFCEARKKEGRLIPAWERLGLAQFLESLDHETIMEFAEGAEGKKSQLEFMKSFLAELNKVIEYSEIATRKQDTGGQGDAGNKLEALTREKMEAKKLSYSTAFAEAQMENPELAQEYASELREV